MNKQIVPSVSISGPTWLERCVLQEQVAYDGLQAKAQKAGGPGLYVDKWLELSTPELSKVANIIDLGKRVNNGQVKTPQKIAVRRGSGRHLTYHT